MSVRRRGVPQPDCIEWDGGTFSPEGYGRIWLDGREYRAHRLAYEQAYGPIPDGMTVDHLCFNPPCMNPQHLRLLTRVENSENQRSAYKTHCKHGHEFTPENTIDKSSYIRNGKRTGRRQCRQCNLDAVKRYQARKRAAA
jgi:hypothetical protein